MMNNALTLSQTLYAQMKEAKELDNTICQNLALLGYKESGYGE